ncbi:hypothetical protein PHJA_000685900, partial [Phtheirospermum japonicum]
QQVGGCTYRVWIDPPICSRACQVIHRFRKRATNLEEQLRSKCSREIWLWAALVCCMMIIYKLA